MKYFETIHKDIEKKSLILGLSNKAFFAWVALVMIGFSILLWAFNIYTFIGVIIYVAVSYFGIQIADTTGAFKTLFTKGLPSHIINDSVNGKRGKNIIE